ncbi:PQQ-dependent sugar dehydrogenase [Allohahella marinimesophila]|uniref:Glucose/Sorbosone dehydrogenase domain-containing protein n=1 Tax=Allohahella marinimesophila TaxID=1054972 RepID=A0ABP7PH17_9GAMM
MLPTNRSPGILYAFVAALILGTVLGSVVQTQINLLALRNLGVDIDASTRLATTVQDLVSFGPVYAAILGVSLAASQSLAVALAKWAGPRWLITLCVLGAAFGLWAAVRLVDALAPMPTLIAATRGGMGMLAMAASAAVAGWVFGRLFVNSDSEAKARSIVPLIGLFSIGGLLVPAEVQADDNYQVETVADGLEHPWSLAFLPDGRMLVTERPGRLRLISADGSLVSTPVAGLPDDIFAEGQTGLLEVLPARDFDQSQQLFLSYSCGDAEANHLCLARARLPGNEDRLVEVEEIFRTQPAKAGAAHFGGRMTWLPDETLILTFGDGFDYREQAQKLDNHLGSIFRLNRDGSTPKDNPFHGQAEIKSEIYSYGHRNVQGLVFDPTRQRLIGHEHGPRGGDEINIIASGANYGWPIATHGLDYTWAHVTPFKDYPGTVQPILHWTPSIAPSGMTLYDGTLFPEWQGSLMVGALVDKSVHRVTFEDNQAVDQERLFEELDERIRDVKTGPDGALYLLTDAPDGRVLRVMPKPQP